MICKKSINSSSVINQWKSTTITMTNSIAHTECAQLDIIYLTARQENFLLLHADDGIVFA